MVNSRLMEPQLFFLSCMRDKNVDKHEIKTFAFPSINFHNLITNKFPFVTDTNLYKTLIWVPSLCAPIINKTKSKLQ